MGYNCIIFLKQELHIIIKRRRKARVEEDLTFSNHKWKTRDSVCRICSVQMQWPNHGLPVGKETCTVLKHSILLLCTSIPSFTFCLVVAIDNCDSCADYVVATKHRLLPNWNWKPVWLRQHSKPFRKKDLLCVCLKGKRRAWTCSMFLMAKPWLNSTTDTDNLVLLLYYIICNIR